MVILSFYFKPILVLFLTLSCFPWVSNSCDEVFEGFGIHLGSMHHFGSSPSSMIPKVFDRIYSDLGIRHYRTSYESWFSLERDVYDIPCRDNSSCAFVAIHNEISKYPNISVMASIWSPPLYMKNEAAQTLLVSEERNYYYFIKNITQLMKDRFNIEVEKVSPVNEPENIFAPWEHTNMTPQQLCRMVHDFNDSLVSVCPENSYYWVSEAYSNTTTNNASVTCLEACEIFGTHAYALHLGNDDDNLLAYYDLVKYTRKVPNMPIWQTEICSTFGRSSERQMEEALDFATNIVNFVGHTCVQRYYFWLSYTQSSSGESLIWGNGQGGLILPKKYFTYKHFTQAAFGGKKQVSKCSPQDLEGVLCIKFGDANAVFVNKLNSTAQRDWVGSGTCGENSFCCTSQSSDWDCTLNANQLPAESICSCRLQS